MRGEFMTKREKHKTFPWLRSSFAAFQTDFHSFATTTVHLEFACVCVEGSLNTPTHLTRQCHFELNKRTSNRGKENVQMTQVWVSWRDDGSCRQRTCLNTLVLVGPCGASLGSLFFFLVFIFESRPRLHHPRRRRRRPLGPWHPGRLRRPPANRRMVVTSENPARAE